MNVKVGYMSYRVFVGDKDWQSSNPDKEGECHHPSGRIYINGDSLQKQQANTLLHEVLHGIWHVWSLPPKCDEETAVTTLANGLCAVILDNPKLLPQIAAMLKEGK